MARPAKQKKPKPTTPKKLKKIETPKSSPTSSKSSLTNSPVKLAPIFRSGPDILYGEDGKTYYPCKHCCRAFASKPNLNEHVIVCIAGRSTPSPFIKKAGSNKENRDVEVNNNAQEEPKTSPTTRSQSKKPEEVEEIDVEKDLKRKSPRASGRKAKRPRSEFPEGETNVITTGLVTENINSLESKTRKNVLRNINKILEKSKITVVEQPDGNIVVQVAANGKHPALHLLSRNVSDNMVEITTKKAVGKKEPNERMPDLAEILEENFGASRPSAAALPDVPQEQPSSDGDDEVESTKSMVRPKSIHQESVLGEIELTDFYIDDLELDEAIVLEDLDIHICKQCGSVYHTLEDLLNHDKYEHRHIKKRYPPSELEKYNNLFKASDGKTCPICSKVLSTKTAWPRHLQTHSDAPNYECKICKKKFTRNDHMKLHEKRHVLPTGGKKSRKDK